MVNQYEHTYSDGEFIGSSLAPVAMLEVNLKLAIPWLAHKQPVDARTLCLADNAGNIAYNHGYDSRVMVYKFFLKFTLKNANAHRAKQEHYTFHDFQWPDVTPG